MKKEYRVMEPVDRKRIAISSMEEHHNSCPLTLTLAPILSGGGFLRRQSREVNCSVTNVDNDKREDRMLTIQVTLLSTGEELRGVITKELINGGYGLLSTYSKNELIEESEEETPEETLFFNNIRQAYRTLKGK